MKVSFAPFVMNRIDSHNVSSNTPRASGKFRAAFLASLASVILVQSAPHTDPKQAAIEAVRKTLPGCKSCHFFAISTKNGLIRKHDLYFVSTLDISPPPIRTVAISTRGKAMVLGFENSEGWNEVLATEGPNLSRDAVCVDYAKAFLDLAVGRAVYVDRLLPNEEERARKKLPRGFSATLRITRAGGKTRLQFFAKDITSSLLWWNLSLESTGKVGEARSVAF